MFGYGQSRFENYLQTNTPLVGDYFDIKMLVACQMFVMNCYQFRIYEYGYVFLV